MDGIFTRGYHWAFGSSGNQVVDALGNRLSQSMAEFIAQPSESNAYRIGRQMARLKRASREDRYFGNDSFQIDFDGYSDRDFDMDDYGRPVSYRGNRGRQKSGSHLDSRDIMAMVSQAIPVISAVLRTLGSNDQSAPQLPGPPAQRPRGQQKNSQADVSAQDAYDSLEKFFSDLED